jgi:hypothetical protein
MLRVAAIALFAAISPAIPAAGWGAESPDLERGRARGRRSSACR